MTALRPTRRALTIHLSIGALAYAIASPVASASQVPISAPLRVGDPFPHLIGQSLADRTIDLPITGAVKPTVVILSFSRDGGTDAQRWAERMSIEPARTESEFVVVAELESVPRLLRGTVRYMIKRGVPQSLRDRMLILDRDDAVWRDRLDVKSMSRSYAVLVDSAGNVHWMSDGPCDGDQIARVLTSIRSLTGGTPPE